MDNSGGLSSRHAVNKKNEARLDCLTTFFYCKRTIREACRTLDACRDHETRMNTRRKELEQEGHSFNYHRISVIDEILADSEALRGYVRAELIKVGEQVYHALRNADDLLNFHDKCQVLGRDHRGVARQMERESIPADTTFSNMVNVYNLEYSGKSDILPIDSPGMPLYSACNRFIFHEMIHNRELTDMAGEMFKDMFPDIPWAELRIDHRGEEYMQRLPPRLRLV